MYHQKDIRDICKNFIIYGDFIKGSPFGSGHINNTYKVLYNQAGTIVPYILQRINQSIFKDPFLLMKNIEIVLNHLKRKYQNRVKNITSKILTLVPVKSGEFLYKREEDNSYWRVYFCIENMATYDVIEDENMAYEGAKAFGKFQRDLSDLSIELLKETIPDFHNTPKRVKAFLDSIEKDSFNRVIKVKKEIERYIKLADRYGEKLYQMYYEGRIRKRICHNDTKFNNIMIDNETGEGKCVIDLDTVMPGFAANDFGDMVRTGACPVAEDDRDLSKVGIDMVLFKAICRGYLEGASDFLTDEERLSLPVGAIIIVMENGIRFLTDYLQGDIYFKINREDHNLDRARNQLKLAEEIDKNFVMLQDIIEKI